MCEEQAKETQEEQAKATALELKTTATLVETLQKEAEASKQVQTPSVFFRFQLRALCAHTARFFYKKTVCSDMR